MDSAPALLAVDLMDRYHQAAQHLKVLREQFEILKKFDGFGLPAEVIEAHRAEATGIFNHMVRLLQADLISADLFCLILPRDGARLWLDCVAPLDHAVRQSAAARSGKPAAGLGETVIEVFYQKYADEGALYIATPQLPPPDGPAGSTH